MSQQVVMSVFIAEHWILHISLNLLKKMLNIQLH